VVAQLDHGRVVRGSLEIGQVDLRLGGSPYLHLVLDLVHHLGEVEFFPPVVVPFDGLRDADIGGHHGFDVVACDELEIVDGEDVGRNRRWPQSREEPARLTGTTRCRKPRPWVRAR